MLSQQTTTLKCVCAGVSGERRERREEREEREERESESQRVRESDRREFALSV